MFKYVVKKKNFLATLMCFSLLTVTAAVVIPDSPAQAFNNGKKAEKIGKVKSRSKDHNKNRKKPDRPIKDVPEPLTILGSAMALGLGGLCKKEYDKKQK